MPNTPSNPREKPRCSLNWLCVAWHSVCSVCPLFTLEWIQSIVPSFLSGSREVAVVSVKDIEGNPLLNVICRDSCLFFVDPRPLHVQVVEFHSERVRFTKALMCPSPRMFPGGKVALGLLGLLSSYQDTVPCPGRIVLNTVVIIISRQVTPGRCGGLDPGDGRCREPCLRGKSGSSGGWSRSPGGR